MVQSFALPLLAAGAATGLLRFLAGTTRSALFASAAVPVGFLVAYLVILGTPPFPPVASSQKLGYLAPAGLAAGFLLDWLGDRPLLRWPLLVGGPALGLYWISRPRLGDLQTTTLLTLLLLWLASLIVFLRLGSAARRPGIEASVMLIMAALGAGAIAFLGRSASLAQLAVALGAAAGGFALWNWPRARYRFGAAALFGGAGSLLGLVSIMSLYSRASLIALALLLPIFFADLLVRKIPSLRLGSALAPLVLGGVCLVPLIAALVAAYGSAPS